MEDKKLSKLNQDELLNKLENWFTDSTSWDKTWRDNAETWYDYYHGNHWTSEEISALEDRGQAVTTYNHVKPIIDSIIGSERQNRPKITMAARTLDDQQVAEAKTKLYDYIQYNSRTDDELDRMVKDAFVTGRGWLYVYPEVEGKNSDIKHSFVDYRDVFVDSLSKRDDMTDSRYVHYGVFTDNDIIATQFEKFTEYSAESPFGFETSSDDQMIWFQNGNRDRVRLINTWYRDENGDVHTVVWVKGQILYYKKQPYSTNRFPFVQYTIERTMENMPYGIVKSMVSAQDEVNKRHSKALHYMNTKQVLAEEDAFVDIEKAKITLAKPDGITMLSDGALTSGKVQIVDNTALASTHIQMMDIAKNTMYALAGLNPTFVGQSSQYESAKKANISISQAQNSLVPILNKLRIARYELAYITMKLVPDFYSSERTIRLIEPNGQYAFMPLNTVKLLDDDTLARINDMSTDDVDIIIEDAPRGLNEREEQFNQLLTIQGQTSRAIPMEILLRYSSIKDKHQLADDLQSYYKIEAQLQQSQQVIEQLQQQVQALGGQVQQQQSQLVQTQVARAVDKEVSKVKDKLNSTLGVM